MSADIASIGQLNSERQSSVQTVTPNNMGSESPQMNRVRLVNYSFEDQSRSQIQYDGDRSRHVSQSVKFFEAHCLCPVHTPLISIDL